MQSMTASIIGNRYLLQETLGHGGMGIVFRALDRLTGQFVALKRVTTPEENLFFTSRDSAADLRLSLAREFQMMSSLRHPNIIGVLDYGFDTEGQSYFTMELVENGQTLTQAADHCSETEKISLILQ